MEPAYRAPLTEDTINYPNSLDGCSRLQLEGRPPQEDEGPRRGDDVRGKDDQKEESESPHEEENESLLTRRRRNRHLCWRLVGRSSLAAIPNLLLSPSITVSDGFGVGYK
ncbi:uncharacterized protein [Palaemon carinicauda]|uniref:uncharacterized protein n=1 Tax=Palaemon carinicauda TaxID=392227 RepID=UPI0035B649C7